MRRLGWAFLRAPWARRAAALTVSLGLLGGNGVLLATTVSAATWTPGTSLGSLTATPFAGLSLSLPQAACQLIPQLCAPGTQVTRILQLPSGLLTLGRPAPEALEHTVTRVTLPSTGCILGLLCGKPTPTPAPKATPTPASTVKPTVAATTASPAPHSTSTPSAPASTPTPAAGGCLLGLVGTGCSGTGLLGLGSSPATPTPAPSVTSPGLCLLNCGLLQLGGQCAASLLGVCVGGQTPSSPPAAGGSATSSGACLAGLCLLGSSCTASLGTTCLVGALLPGLALPGLTNNPPPSGSSGPGAPSGGGTPGSGSGATTGSGSQPTGSTSTEGLLGAGAFPTSSSPGTGSQSGTSGPSTPPPGGDESVGLVSGLSFGHGLILWPLFGLLDLAALAGLVVVVRRRWAATTN